MIASISATSEKRSSSSRAYTRRGRAAFLGDSTVRDAVLRNLEVIGEAVKNLSSDIRARRAGIPWPQITGLKDVLIHQYFGVDLELVWEIVENRLSGLKADVDTLLGEIE